jgi:hypothetical protein
VPRIFDNIDQQPLPALRETLELSSRSDFCVGYFNLRGWKAIDALIENWPGGAAHQCRLLVGMQRLPQDELRQAYSLLPHEDEVSNQAVIRVKRKLAEEFRAQLTFGAPNDAARPLEKRAQALGISRCAPRQQYFVLSVNRALGAIAR